MRSINRITIVGRLGQDPEIRMGKNQGQAFAVLSVATDRNRREGETWVEETDWHRVKAFGRDAEFASRHIKRGVLVAVTGTLAYERWTDKEGGKHSRAVLLADELKLLSIPMSARAERADRAPVVEPASEVVAEAK